MNQLNHNQAVTDTPTATPTATQLAAVWKKIHADYKLISADGTKSILILRNNGTTLVPLSELTVDEVSKFNI